jgi:hypothetical protein
LTANNDSQFSGGKDDEGVWGEENEDEDKQDEGNKLILAPRDGWSQQYNASTPQTMGTGRRKIRDEEERIARLPKHVQTTQHPEENTMAEKWSPYYRDFPESQNATYILLKWQPC